MFRKRSSSGFGVACLIVTAAMCLAPAAPPAADDQAAPAPADGTSAPASGHVTRSLTIHAPSVAVRTNPSAAQGSPDSGTAPERAGQWVFVDSNGNILPGPPPGTSLPAITPRAPVRSAPYTSPVDPGTTLADTRHIHAVAVGRVNESGTIDIVCRQHTDSPDHECEVRRYGRVEGSERKPDTTNKEERE
jgi:hypothetical protein